MFGFKKNKHATQDRPTQKQGLFASLKSKLSKTRSNLSAGLADIFLGKKQIDSELLEQLEDQLLMADAGIEATQLIIARLTDALDRKQLGDDDSVYATLHQAMAEILADSNQPLVIDDSKKPFVILMIGINGAGKTTTIGKLAQQFKDSGKSVMLAAGDTFRAAAVEQLQSWGKRLDIPVIAQGSGADAASVIFDALQSAKSKNIDILIADTAGRLHTQQNLMNELEKIKRVMSKIDPKAPHETMLVLDAGTGQNALAQAQSFHDKLGITGITLTKLDGTARGGIVFSLAQRMKLPIRFIGVGETAQDLRVFDADEFIGALLEREE